MQSGVQCAFQTCSSQPNALLGSQMQCAGEILQSDFMLSAQATQLGQACS